MFGIFGQLSANVSGLENRIKSLNGDKQNILSQEQTTTQDISIFSSDQTAANTDVISSQQAINNAISAISEAQSTLSDIQLSIFASTTGSTNPFTEKINEAKIQAAEEKLATAQKELEQAEAENQKAQEEYDKLSEKLTALETSLDDIQNNKTNIDEQIQNTQNELAEAKQQAENAKNTNEQEPNKITKITNKDKKSITSAAEKLLNPGAYSKKELKKAKDKVNFFADSDYEIENKEVADFISMTQDLGSNDINKNEKKRHAVIDKINEENGVAKQSATAIKAVFGEQKKGIKENKHHDNHGAMEKYYKNAKKEAGNPWCATFVSWSYGKGQKEYSEKGEKVNTKNKNTFGYQASVQNLRESAKEAGHYAKKSKYKPVPGDLMVQKGNGASHVAMVVKTDKKYVYTIEGNAGDAVKAKKYAIKGKAYKKKVSGYVKMSEWNGGKNAPLNVDYNKKIKYKDADKNYKESTL